MNDVVIVAKRANENLYLTSLNPVKFGSEKLDKAMRFESIDKATSALKLKFLSLAGFLSHTTIQNILIQRLDYSNTIIEESQDFMKCDTLKN